MKEFVNKHMNAIFGWLFVAVIVFFAIATKPDNSTPSPAVPVDNSSSITRIPGSMGFEVNAYKVHTEGLDFLVIVNANKGGVTVTRIK